MPKVTPEEAMKKWETNFSAAAPKIIEHATSPKASERYVREIAAFLGIPESEVRDEDAKRVAGLQKLTPEKLRERVAGKGPKWYEGMKYGFLKKVA